MKFSTITIIFGIGSILLITSPWEYPINAFILKQRKYTSDVFRDALYLARVVESEDRLREFKGEPSIYPSDLGITDKTEYVAYLLENKILREPLDTDLEEIKFGNISRHDPADTIFVLSSKKMRDIHTMIHQIGGGILQYSRGFVAIRKNGKGQFYKSSERDNETKVGLDPPRDPEFF